VNPYALSVFSFGVASFFIGLLVWIKLGSRMGLYYFLFSAFAGLWGMFEGQQFSNNFDYDKALFFARCSNSAAIFIGPFWYHFTLAFQRKKYDYKHKVILIIFYSVAIFIFIFSFTDAFVPKVFSIVGIAHYSSPGPLWHVFTVLFFTSVPMGFAELIKYLNNVSGNEKQQCLWLIWTTGIGFSGGGLTFPPVYGFPLPQYGLLIMPLYPVLMAVSMMRYGLLTEENLILAAHKDKLAALGILTASINHEIRAPLFMMRGLAETQVKDSELGKNFLTQIDRITGIVSRLTHFAKKGVEEEAQIEPIDLKEVLADIRPLFQHQLNYQSIEFTQDIPTNFPKVMADRRYLEEILFNLILNACQALKETPNPKISLSAVSSSRLVVSKAEPSRGSTSGSAIAITIADNGPGIPQDQLKNIFKPFHTTKLEGTGLGLYITKQLVEKCGGKIEVKSELSKGAQFVVRFNLR